MRPFFTAIVLAGLALCPVAASADGRCDLNTVVGYHLVFAKPIEAYIQGGTRTKGFEGCAPDRTLVFADNTGVRCITMGRQPRKDLPTGYLFAKNPADMKICIEGALYDVSHTN